MWDFIVPNSLWKIKGKCATSNYPDLWFSSDFHDTQLAQRICAHCPVIKECLIHAFTHPEPYGVWGGMTEKERRKARKPR